ncbi:MAG: T9SS type A sorting domain-containing protein [Bacteroidales bacterium]|nr:T9SS type A sorting domain-containing protein [Bacteroidales bacterium]
MLFVIEAKSQIPAPQMKLYLNIQDTTILDNGDSLIIYYPPNYSSFIMPYDTTVEYFSKYDRQYYNRWVHRWPVYDNDGNYLIFELNHGPFLCKNSYRPEGFAQPFHLEDTMAIVGVAAKIAGNDWDAVELKVDESSRFRLYDKEFNQLDVDCYNFYVLDPVTGDGGGVSYYNPLVNKHGYLFNYVHYLTDFYIAADEYYTDVPLNNSKPWYGFCRSVSIFDTIWQDTLIGSQEPYSPYLKKDGEWRRFADDTVYQFIQKTFIEFLPITYHPHQVSSLEEISDESFSIFPNPAKEEITIESSYDIERIEISNTLGVTQKSLKVKGNKIVVPISDLEKGTYLVSIRTSEGNHTKKIVKE